jgi:hypothetical protein
MANEPHAPTVTEFLQEKILKQTVTALKKFDEIRRSLELPVDQLPAVIAIYDKVMNAETAAVTDHIGQLVRINAQMFDGTLRVLSQQNEHLHSEVKQLTAEIGALRSELEKARAPKDQ